MKCNKFTIKKLLSFCLILIGLANPHNTLPMDPSPETDASQVRMHMEDDEEYVRSERPAIPDVGANEQDLAKQKFLPAHLSFCALKGKMTDKQTLEFLTYLATFKKNNSDNRSLFSKGDQELFDKTVKLEKRTAWWMSKGQAMCYSSVLSGAALGFIALNDDIPQKNLIIALNATSAVINGFNAWLNFYATGTLPDEANRFAVDRTYSFDDSREIYMKASLKWVDLYFAKDQYKRNIAIGLATKLKDETLPHLQTQVRKNLGLKNADKLLYPIEEVIHYILNPNEEKLGKSPIVENRILLKEQAACRDTYTQYVDLAVKNAMLAYQVTHNLQDAHNKNHSEERAYSSMSSLSTMLKDKSTH